MEKDFDDEVADAFYDENYPKLTKLLGRKIHNQMEAEQAYEGMKKAQELSERMEESEKAR